MKTWFIAQVGTPQDGGGYDWRTLDRPPMDNRFSAGGFLWDHLLAAQVRRPEAAHNLEKLHRGQMVILADGTAARVVEAQLSPRQIEIGEQAMQLLTLLGDLPEPQPQVDLGETRRVLQNLIKRAVQIAVHP